MSRKTLILLMGSLNLLAAFVLPAFTSALVNMERTVSMSAFSDLVSAGVITIDAQKAKDYRNGPMSGDWGDVSLYTTLPFQQLRTASYLASAILFANAFVFLMLWLRMPDTENAAMTKLSSDSAGL
jgi:hypothetical protein